MPMTGSVGQRISEFHKGRVYARTKAKFGKATANKQAIAAALASSRKSIGQIHRESKKKK